MSDNNEERYLYTVYPKKPIKNLNEAVPLLRVSRSLFLTKEEVAKCFECGSVYRRFSNEGITEKFNKYEIDRVHRAKYISKEDWAKMQKDAVEEQPDLTVNGATPDPIPVELVVEKNEEQEPVVVEEPKVEEPVVEAVVVEEQTSEPAPAEEVPVVTSSIQSADETLPTESETTVSAPEDPVVVDTTGEIVEDSITEDTVVEEVEVDDEEEEEVDEQPTNNSGAPVINYNKKKKHH